MAIEVSRKKKADTSPGTGRYPPESGRASLESTRLGIMNSVNLKEEHASLRRLIIFNSSTDLIMKSDTRWEELRNLLRELLAVIK